MKRCPPLITTGILKGPNKCKLFLREWIFTISFQCNHSNFMCLGELFQQHNFIAIKRGGGGCLRTDLLPIRGRQISLPFLGFSTLIWENKKSVELFASALMFGFFFSLTKVLKISMNKNEPQFWKSEHSPFPQIHKLFNTSLTSHLQIIFITRKKTRATSTPIFQTGL